MSAWECRCGHYVVSSGSDMPSVPRWSDGHVCRLRPVGDPPATPAPDPLSGFKEWQTGGGCLALGKSHENGGYILITDQEGTDLPSSGRDALVGFYDSESDCIGLIRGIAWDDLKSGKVRIGW